MISDMYLANRPVSRGKLCFPVVVTLSRWLALPRVVVFDSEGCALRGAWRDLLCLFI